MRRGIWFIYGGPLPVLPYQGKVPKEVSKFFTKQIIPADMRPVLVMQEQRTFSPGAYVRPDWLFITFSLFCFWAGGMVKLPQQYVLLCSRQPPHVSSGSSSGREPMSKSAELSGNIKRGPQS